MRNALIALAVLAAPVAAQDKPAATAPSEIVASAPKEDWVAIAASDLLVMDLAPDAKGKPRRVVIQLMPAPFSRGWIGNIRKLAAARWWDGTSVNRVQDNYVVQWGDGEAEDKVKAKKLPMDLESVADSYSVDQIDIQLALSGKLRTPENEGYWKAELSGPVSTVPLSPELSPDIVGTQTKAAPDGWHQRDSYVDHVQFHQGWPLALADPNGPGFKIRFWPVHCYGMVGVGRDMPPSTGSGAELYTVIGHAPRHLDRNIALVGRVIEGIEHLSSLPRGTAPLGFYATAEERTAIHSIRLASDLPGGKPIPAYEYLSTESVSFAAYTEARANRRDAFFIRPAGGADICNIPVPVRRVK